MKKRVPRSSTGDAAEAAATFFELRTLNFALPVPEGLAGRPFDRLRACLLCSRHAAAIGVHGAGCRVRLGGLELEDACWQEREGRLAILAATLGSGLRKSCSVAKKYRPTGR